MISWSVIAMKNNLVVLSLLFYGLVVLLYNAFTINPGTCLEQHTELPAPQREQPLSERVDKEDENSSSFSAAEAGKPVAVKAGKHDDALVKKDEESILKGKDLYKKLCEKCHDAYSTKNTTGPGMQGILRKIFCHPVTNRRRSEIFSTSSITLSVKCLLFIFFQKKKSYLSFLF